LILTATVLAADDNADLTTKGRERLQGDWKVVGAQRDGKEVEEANKITWRFDGKKIVMTGKGEEEKAKFELVTKTVSGSFSGGSIDMTWAAKNETLLGVYGLDEDRLLLNFAPAGEKRPEGYVPPKGTKGSFWVLDRIKK